MANLAIRGHASRGNEVIEILEMLGGKNIYKYRGHRKDLVYFINSDYYGSIDNDTESNTNSYKLYSLEDFHEKFPYKVGDKVKTIYGKIGIVKRLVWSNKDNVVRYELKDDEDSLYFANELRLYEEETMEEELMPKIDFSKYCKNKYLLDMGDYEIKVEDGKTYVVRKKPQYPKTYEECCKVLGLDSYFEPEIRNATTEECNKFMKLMRLKRCRNVYWKIAGEELGLEKPWEPDWKDCTKPKYTIHLHCDGHIFWQDVSHTEYRWLSFPTTEIRDAFYENFKDLIEQCKELL